MSCAHHSSAISSSPAKARSVSVAPGIELEVLEWGSAGEPVMLLAGFGHSAHVFEDFAPTLAEQFHVFALTRRGFGLSSVPESGYDLSTLSADVVHALDALGLNHVTLIGHSAGGDEVSFIAAEYPARVTRAVYLDAAYDRTDPAMQPEALGECFNVAPPSEADIATVEAFGAWFNRTRGTRVPTSELHSMFEHHGPAEGAFETYAKSLVRPRYEKIAAAALAIYAVPESAADFYPTWATMTKAERAKAVACFESGAEQPASRASRAEFRARVAHGETVELLHASHYLFIENRARVLAEIIRFLK